MATPLVPLKIVIAYLKSPTWNPDFSCEKFLDFLHMTEISALLAYFCSNLVAMATPLVALKGIEIAYLKSPTQNRDILCEKYLDFLHRTEISAILAYFSFKFGCHGNSLGSLKNSDSVLKFNSPEIPTVHAINFPISCRELISAIFLAQIRLPWQPF